MNDLAFQQSGNPDQYEKDRAETIRNQKNLAANGDLVFWYKKLYEHQFEGIPDLEKLVICKSAVVFSRCEISTAMCLPAMFLVSIMFSIVMI